MSFDLVCVRTCFWSGVCLQVFRWVCVHGQEFHSLNCYILCRHVNTGINTRCVGCIKLVPASQPGTCRGGTPQSLLSAGGGGNIYASNTACACGCTHVRTQSVDSSGYGIPDRGHKLKPNQTSCGHKLNQTNCVATRSPPSPVEVHPFLENSTVRGRA